MRKIAGEAEARRALAAVASSGEGVGTWARAHGIDLGRSWAYSDSYSDYPMLATVGRPTVVNPDWRLRAVARSYDWPVIDLR